ncbi:serine/threonine protein kinase [Myxococcus stipitatus DSM 14675]|uniref:non-specific serine/threonine protein kinase n=1 Tax=Myxococcus stipitatus (strain DSM 14675 / JCM 12634 / Mx s8) TaxID=1278073 RepID=L7U8N0_MYXSD|nr:serine/threonine-protein kinase [Myxococcus stipitatus]AGC42834.1 serine/threonine protein kinase [Myxococcus stipitatus DSM 14675]
MAEVSSGESCEACGQRHGPSRSCPTLVREEKGDGAARPRCTPVGGETDPLVGARLGSFRLVRRLGRGGMGTVYLGEHVSIGSRVAVKVLHEHLAMYPELVQRFHAEARAVNVIGHENIVSIFDLNAGPPRPYLIMEYLDGAPLSAWVGTPLPAPAVVSVLSQVCDALQAAHLSGIIHRDLKPDNVFLVRRGRSTPFVKVLDFGIAKLVDARMPQTHAGIIVGTPEYMAPEQSQSRKVDGRADLYALGVIAFQLLTGRLPFEDEGLAAQLVAHQMRAPPSLRSLHAAVPEPLERVILRALAKTPEERFTTAAVLRAALEGALAVSARPPSPRPARPPAPVRTASPVVVSASGEPEELVAPWSPVPQASSPGWAAAPRGGPGVASPVSAPAPDSSERRGPPVGAVPVSPGGPQGRARTVELSVRVVLRPGETPIWLTASDLSRGGLFLRSEGVLPPLFSRLPMVLELDTGPHNVVCEVVHHVPAEQARLWGMATGFGVQFVEASLALKTSVDALLRAGPGHRPSPPVPMVDDAMATRVLEAYRMRLTGDHYAVLAVTPDLEMGALRARAREARSILESLRQRPLSPSQCILLDSVLGRLLEAGDVLGTVTQRALYDAWRGNHRGVARCLEAGLTPEQLDSLRRQFLARRPQSSGMARVHYLSGSALEREGQLARALETYERGLALDPLESSLHLRYRSVRRALDARGAAEPSNDRARSP